MKKKIGEYTEKIVGFVDILGFSSLVQRSKSDPQIIQLLKSIYDSVEEACKNPDIGNVKSNQYQYTEVIYFSDSIIVSSAATIKGIASTISALSTLQHRLLCHGILVRGGVTVGDTFKDERIIFGPAIIDAYRLEQLVSIYPRIIIDEKFASFCRSHKEFEDFGDRFIQDDDGTIFIDPFWKYKLSQMNSIIENEIAQMRQFIEKECKYSINNQSIFDKYNWLIKLFNEFVRTDAPKTTSIDILECMRDGFPARRRRKFMYRE